MSTVNDEQIIKVLKQYNPWWQIPSAIKEESKPHRRLAYYEAYRMLTHNTIKTFCCTFWSKTCWQDDNYVSGN